MQIQISGQYGDPKADGIFWPIQKKLNDCFKANISDGYFQTLSKLAIAFRVSGKAQNFDSKGSERMKYLKKDKCITIDLVFPIEQWVNTASEDLIKTITAGVLNCLNLMIDKSKILGELRDEKRLLSNISNALHDFEEHQLKTKASTVK
ncbi:hypothetical protein AQS70_22365 [Pseudomonas endophytica]|uniref:Uncharacterized protein n=1 Tax=Pseudomonas endophytica TaxID=1563157 RepID=A0A0Q0SQH7_9PSED|nr:hypothetical protein [Pseudomonas endophytica]KQB54235.1 hypothetical protein AQS70_22365 [Pseudomonas endophytica]